MNYSYWEQQSILKPADFMIIGMGLTGLQTAIAIKEREQQARVVVCDRFAWSKGASTRNAGFACFANISEILDDLENHSEAEVYQLAADRYQGLQMLRKNLGDKQIGYSERGSVEIFTQENKPDMERGLDALQQINTQLFDFMKLDRVFEFSSKSVWDNVLGAFHNRYEGQLHTGKLYQALLQKAKSIGIELYGGLTYKSYARLGDQIEVSFNEALQWKTSHLLICTNAFASLHTEEDIVPARGQVLVTEVLQDLPCQGLHHYDKGYYYWRDIDGRILLGGARNLDAASERSTEIEQNTPIVAELKRFLFEQICGKEVTIEHQWSGIMGMGKGNQKEPIIKNLDTNVFLAARLGGMGVALSALIAKRLSEKVLD